MKHPCALCGKKLSAERLLYSRHTGQRYCRDMKTCDARAAKRRKREAAAA